MHGKSPSRFFSKAEEARIVAAIQAAEQETSGEIRIHLLRSDQGDLLNYAQQLLEKLGITRTRDRNGVLFLMELKSQRFAVVGDRGIHEKVGQEFWDSIRDRVLERFRHGEFEQGLIEGIQACGDKMKEFFPLQADDENELTNQITESS
ncbi:MAG TPA: TPM domain-containing protein [bacterium]|nr:TPM domain-containing protein [bacterium]